MKRFHFMNNVDLNDGLSGVYEECGCRRLTVLMRRLFKNEEEFLNFMNCYCNQAAEFPEMLECSVDSYVSIPEPVYNSMKLCHKEQDTFSIALIWRSFLIDVIECFRIGKMDAWLSFKANVIDIITKREIQDAHANSGLISYIINAHMINFSGVNIGKIVFFDKINNFLAYLRC